MDGELSVRLLSEIHSGELLCAQEQAIMTQYFNNPNVDNPTKANVILIAETLMGAKLPKRRKQALNKDFRCGNKSPDVWKSSFKSIIDHLTVERTFEPQEMDFLVSLVWNKYRVQYQTADKKKKCGPFANKTFWFALTFDYNLKFHHRMRNVVGLRNKFKGLIQGATHPSHLAPFLAELRERRGRRSSETGSTATLSSPHQSPHQSPLPSPLPMPSPLPLPLSLPLPLPQLPQLLVQPLPPSPMGWPEPNAVFSPSSTGGSIASTLSSSSSDFASAPSDAKAMMVDEGGPGLPLEPIPGADYMEPLSWDAIPPPSLLEFSADEVLCLQEILLDM